MCNTPEKVGKSVMSRGLEGPSCIPDVQLEGNDALRAPLVFGAESPEKAEMGRAQELFLWCFLTLRQAERRRPAPGVTSELGCLKDIGCLPWLRTSSRRGARIGKTALAKASEALLSPELTWGTFLQCDSVISSGVSHRTFSGVLMDLWG